MSLSIRLSLFYASLCLFGGVQMPFFPVWLKYKGLGPQEISIIIAATMFLRIVAGPLFALIADRLDDRRRVVIALSWASLASVGLFLFTEGFWQIFGVTLVLMALWPSITPLIETIAMRAAHEQGIDYGRVRLWCSITFIVGSSGTGWLLGFNTSAVIALCLIGAIAINLVGAYLLAPELPTRRKRRSRGNPLKGIFDILRQPVFMLGITTASIIQSSHAVYYAFGTLNWQRQGYADTTIGLLLGRWCRRRDHPVCLFRSRGGAGRRAAPDGAGRGRGCLALGSHRPQPVALCAFSASGAACADLLCGASGGHPFH